MLFDQLLSPRMVIVIKLRSITAALPVSAADGLQKRIKLEFRWNLLSR